MGEKTPWSFCETPEEKCTMNYCDENGCLNRKKNLVKGGLVESQDSCNPSKEMVDPQICEGCEKTFDTSEMRTDEEDGNWFCKGCIEEMKKPENNTTNE
jgi:hypothetical protein